jgi:hypothetical protein
VRQQRVQRSLTRTRTRNTHALDNSKPEADGHVVGIYRWVDRIQTVQVFKYPHRLLYEFEVPEPGAFIRWLNARTKPGPLGPITPFTLEGTDDGTPLMPSMITGFDKEKVPPGEVNFHELGSRYNVQGLPPPPTNVSVFAVITNDTPEPAKDGEPLVIDPDGNKPTVYKTSSISIPDGWEGVSFALFVSATNGLFGRVGGTNNYWQGWLEITVGTDFVSKTGHDDVADDLYRFENNTIHEWKDMQSIKFRSPVTGQVPILLATDDTLGLMANLQVYCQPTETAVLNWRTKVFDLVLNAYLGLQKQKADSEARAAIQTGIVISGESAARNAEVVREEIKRAAIELLMGERFDGRPAMEVVVSGEADRIAFDAVRKTAEEIQFIEQAFEWENLSFVLYPYYWADSKKWPELETISSPDADFDRFLRAGSARVVVPARPGFEAATQLYTTFGLLWGGGPAAAPEDDLYLSVADEIRAQQQAPADGEPGKSWPVRLPTTLVYLSPIGTTLPLDNAGAELPKPAGPPAPN